MKNIAVEFTLTSELGGLKLSQTSATSDKDGYVSTSVISGTVSTSIRVTATAKDASSISTQSSQLVVATGLPEQKSMSLAVEKFNPAGWGHNGITSSVNILLADTYHNPAADGTVVSFTTEGGSIQASCTTLNGGCSVLWKSQSPRPPRNSTDNSIERKLCLNITDPSELNACEAERAGRSKILATAIGNESFKDRNGNGIFDPGVDTFTTNPTDIEDPKHNICTPNDPVSSFESLNWGCDDLPEAYLDANENGTYETGEIFTNFITDKTHDLGTDNYTPNNGIYNGSFCQPSDETKGYCSRNPITIRREHMVIMSCAEPLLDNGFLPKVSDGSYAVADCNGNALPLGSTITVGTNPPTTVGNQYNWNTIFATPGTEVKLVISTGSSTDTLFVYTN